MRYVYLCLPHINCGAFCLDKHARFTAFPSLLPQLRIKNEEKYPIFERSTNLVDAARVVCTAAFELALAGFSG